MLRGTRDGKFLKQDHEYLIFEINRCHDSIRNTTILDSNCDPDEEDCETVDP